MREVAVVLALFLCGNLVLCTVAEAQPPNHRSDRGCATDVIRGFLQQGKEQFKDGSMLIVPQLRTPSETYDLNFRVAPDAWGQLVNSNAPPGVTGSRITEADRKTTFANLKTDYERLKARETSRSALRKALEARAEARYLDLVGGDNSLPKKLKPEEDREIDQLVRRGHAKG